MSTYKEFKDYLDSEECQRFLRMTNEEILREAQDCVPPDNPRPSGTVLEFVQGPDGVWALPEEPRKMRWETPGSPYFYANLYTPPIRPFWDFGGGL